jgi:hypothetical protein
MEGDLRTLSAPERLLFMKDLCRSLGLNWRTRPFEYIVFTDRDRDDEEQQDSQNPPAGKMILYARADCAAQLRKIHKVGIEKNLKRWREGEFYYAEANLYIYEKAGVRTDSAIGVVWLKKWKKGANNTRTLVDVTGQKLANLMMKAETKAKRRGTFSICGLHMLDESELDDLTNITYDVTESGRVVEVATPGQAPPRPALEAGAPIGQELYELAVAMAQRQSQTAVPFKKRVEEIQTQLRQNSTPAQISALHKKFTEPQPAQAPQPTGQQSPGAAAADRGGAAEGAPDNFDGITIKAIGNDLYQLVGLKSVLREAWSVIKMYWKQNAKPPAFIATAQETGKVMAALEKAHIKHRWL